MARPLSACRRIASIERRARAFLLRWIASGAAIEESRDGGLDDRELAALLRAVEEARKAGR